MIGALIGAGASVLGSVAGSAFSAKSAKDSMKFQEKMARHAHQWEVEDLRAAGLNPILSAGGSGARASGGAQYTAENPMRDVAQNYIASAKAKLERNAIRSSIAQVDSSTARTLAEKQAVVDRNRREQEVHDATMPGLRTREAVDIEKEEIVKDLIETGKDLIPTTAKTLREKWNALKDYVSDMAEEHTRKRIEREREAGLLRKAKKEAERRSTIRFLKVYPEAPY